MADIPEPDERRVPTGTYGILERDQFPSEADEIAEQVRRVGYAVVDARLGAGELATLRAEFERTRSQYVARHGEARLRALGEYHTVRALLTQGGRAFLQLVFNEKLHAVIGKLIAGQFVLNQQNGVINPPGETYGQGQWHRDLPYQHFVASRPLAVNALFCLDEFTTRNGSTFVLPASHKAEAFPSADYVRSNALQIEAPAGCFILLDCMTFHAGGFNASERERRAVNHVFTIPFLRQQIRLPGNLRDADLTAEQQRILGFGNVEPESVEAYLDGREGKRT
jgi:ectoine hydroxylase-related dioxygenase (phytanoyl-CoA dioxygenase family)